MKTIKLIIEGPPGSGKSLLMQYFQKVLNKKGIGLSRTSEYQAQKEIAEISTDQLLTCISLDKLK